MSTELDSDALAIAEAWRDGDATPTTEHEVLEGLLYAVFHADPWDSVVNQDAPTENAGTILAFPDGSRFLLTVTQIEEGGCE